MVEPGDHAADAGSGSPLFGAGVLGDSGEVSELGDIREAARKTADLHQLLVASVEEYAIFTLDRTGRVLSWNAGAARAKGYAAAEIIGQHFQLFYTPEDLAADRPRTALQTAARMGRFEDEGWRVRKDGTRFWANVVISALRDDEGVLVGFGKVTRDLTGRRRAEEALRESESRFRAAFDQAAIGMTVTRHDGQLLRVNRVFCALLGYSEAELLARTFQSITYHDDLLNDAQHFERLLAGEIDRYELEKRYVHKEGHLVWTSLTVAMVHDESGAPPYAVAQVQDITERRHAESVLEESEQRYRSLFTYHPDAVFSLGLDGRFASANPACEVVSGYTPRQLVGQPFARLIVPEDLAATMAAFDTVVAGSAVRFQIAIGRRTGGRVNLDVTGLPITVDGTVVGVFGIAKDRTAQLELEAQLRQAQKMEAVGQLAGGVAHDFNNIIAAIVGYAELLQMDLTPDDPHRGDVGEILSAALRAAGLTRQLLAFSRKQVLQPRVLDLNRVVEDSVTLLRPLLGGAVHLATLVAPAPVLVSADRIQLEQVLMNLVVNARDAMPEGGTVSVEVATSSEASPMALLVVSDTGAGMSPAVQAHAFEPFFTTKPVGKGTGLGLATVHGIVEQSGGTVHIETNPGVGSTFTVRLPLAGSITDAPELMQVTDSVAKSAGTVLLADDEEAVRNIARRILERAGYTVLVARHGADAQLLLEEHGGAIDMLLSDVVMPEMGGIELARRAVALVPDLPVILMSGYTYGDIDDLAEGRVVDGLLQKPFTAAALLETVRKALNLPHRGD